MHLDIELALWRNLVKATTTSITLHVDDAQTVAGILADALEAGEQTIFNLRLVFLGFRLQLLLFLTRLLHDFVELALLVGQCDQTVFLQCNSLLQVVVTLIDANQSLFDFLLAELNLESLELYLLCQRVILAVVLHLVELLLIAVDIRLGLVDLALLHRDSALVVLDFVLDLLNTSVQTGNLVFQVLHFERQLATHGALLIDTRKRCLQLIQRLQLLFY